MASRSGGPGTMLGDRGRGSGGSGSSQLGTDTSLGQQSKEGYNPRFTFSLREKQAHLSGGVTLSLTQRSEDFHKGRQRLQQGGGRGAGAWKRTRKKWVTVSIHVSHVHTTARAQWGATVKAFFPSRRWPCRNVLRGERGDCRTGRQVSHPGSRQPGLNVRHQIRS